MNAEISRDEARNSLADVDAIAARTRRAIASSHAGYLLMMWGLIWIVCYAATQICLTSGRSHFIMAIWLSLCGAGVVVTFVVIWWKSRTGLPTRTPEEKKRGLKEFGFWSFLYVYIFLWLAINPPSSGVQINAFVVTAIMLGFVVSGLREEVPFFVWLGLGITAVTLVGVFLIPISYYCIWMALVAGGSLFGIGSANSSSLEMSMSEIDEIIHQSVRLRIMTSLVALEMDEQVEFTYLRNLLKLTNGNMGGHLMKLESAGYIKIDKTFVGRTPRTFIKCDR